MSSRGQKKRKKKLNNQIHSTKGYIRVPCSFFTQKVSFGNSENRHLTQSEIMVISLIQHHTRTSGSFDCSYSAIAHSLQLSSQTVAKAVRNFSPQDYFTQKTKKVNFTEICR